MNPTIQPSTHPFLQRHVRATELPLERLAGSTKVSQAGKVAEVSRQFEAVLLRQILSDAQKPMFASTMNPRSVASGVYQDMITDKLADSISRSGSFGLAGCLKTQLAHELRPDRAPGAIGSQKSEGRSQKSDVRPPPSDFHGAYLLMGRCGKPSTGSQAGPTHHE